MSLSIEQTVAEVGDTSAPRAATEDSLAQIVSEVRQAPPGTVAIRLKGPGRVRVGVRADGSRYAVAARRALRPARRRPYIAAAITTMANT